MYEEDWERREWEALKKELEENDPIIQNISAVSFFSFSRGRNRRKRRYPRRVVLIRIKPNKKWYFWSGNDRSLPWDEWASEILGRQHSWELEDNDCYIMSPGDWLRKRTEEYLREYDGKFQGLLRKKWEPSFILPTNS